MTQENDDMQRLIEESRRLSDRARELPRCKKRFSLRLIVSKNGLKGLSRVGSPS